MVTKQELINIIKDNGIEKGDFVLSSGKKSSYYIDLRKVTLSSHIYEIVEYLSMLVKDLEFDAIGGPTVGADPIVGAFLFLHEQRGFLVRSKPKTHGKPDFVIGSVKPGDRCILVEDVVTSGQSLISAANHLQNMNCKIVKAFSIIDREEGASEIFKKCNIPFESFLTVKDLNLEGENV